MYIGGPLGSNGRLRGSLNAGSTGNPVPVPLGMNPVRPQIPSIQQQQQNNYHQNNQNNQGQGLYIYIYIYIYIYVCI
jgi:hypothetical protein